MNFISYILFASRDRLMSFVGCNWAINFFHEAKTTVFYLNQQFLNAGMGVVLKISGFFYYNFHILKKATSYAHFRNFKVYKQRDNYPVELRVHVMVLSSSTCALRWYTMESHS